MIAFPSLFLRRLASSTRGHSFSFASRSSLAFSFLKMIFSLQTLASSTHRSRNKVHDDGSWHIIVYCTFCSQTVGAIDRHGDCFHKNTNNFVSDLLIFHLFLYLASSKVFSLSHCFMLPGIQLVFLICRCSLYFHPWLV